MSEYDSYWLLPLQGLRLIQLRLDHGFGMELGAADSEYSVRVNTTFTLKDPDGIVELSAERLSEIGPALRLFNAEITDAKAFKSGRLEMGFSTKMFILVEPDDRFEAWEVVSHRMNGLLVVAQPIGGLAIWSNSGCSRLPANQRGD